VTRRLLAAAAGGIGLIALAWSAGSSPQRATVNPEAALSPDPDGGNVQAPAPPSRAKAPPAPPPITSDTPMAERVAVLGVLNKRNGVARDIALHPGQAARFGDLVVRLRACETTADWEPEQLTGAFVQADVRGTDGGWRRAFSGWLFKESPSLNVVPSALYDVWPKSCAMRHPDTGPDTVSASAPSPPRRSSAKKSAGDGEAPAPAQPAPSAPSNNET